MEQKKPTNAQLQKRIANASKLEIAIHKAVDASIKMEDAFRSGDVDGAWRAREKAINASSREIRYQLAQRVRYQLRKMPELHFYIDDSLDYIENIDNLLKK